MNSSEIHIVILAAGQGTRMKSALAKVLHHAAGQPMIEHVLRASDEVDPTTVTVVIGHQADSVRLWLTSRNNVQCVVQSPQLGTGHALRQAEVVLSGRTGTVVLLSADVPLLTGATLRRLVETHRSAGAAATVVTAVVERPHGYGRIIRSDGRIASIVEQRDATPEQQLVNEINSGIYAFDAAPLFESLRGIAAANAQGEYYLTDIVGVYRQRDLPVETLIVGDPREVRGVNNRSELADVSAIMRQKKNQELMASGVTIVDPTNTYIDADVVVGSDTVIHPGVVIEGQTRIGSACEIQAYSRITNSELADNVTILNFCVIVGARVAQGAAIGPFAHLRPATDVGRNAKVGNFVELKKTSLGAGSKANHLSYLGDATIGANVNVGAGTITCNYDGERKHETVVEDDAFIGSASQLIAPVRVGRGAYVCAGSSITRDVPPGALGIARGRQDNVEGWAGRRKQTPPKA
jgi:bifunctional UDP-N-acetylglucosamine pyrophosphorylase / glucosamine-1-phosphate N-acetyltransferase